MGTFGIVVLHHNESRLLERCFRSLADGQRPADRLVLVDNASRPEEAKTAKRIVEDFGGVFVDAGGNDGYAAGNNVGLRHLHEAGVDIAVLVNPDATLGAGCIARLVDHLGEHDRVAAANPLVLNDSGRVWSAGGRFSPWQGRLLQPGFGGAAADIPGGDTGFVTGCVLALKLAALEQVGLLDEDLFIYYEDVDLSERMLAAGWRLSLLADTTATHRRGAFGDPDRNLSPFMLRHTMSSRGALVRGRLTGVQRLSALLFTPLMVGRFGWLVARSSSSVKREQLRALWAGTVEGLRRRPLDARRIPRFEDDGLGFGQGGAPN